MERPGVDLLKRFVLTVPTTSGLHRPARAVRHTAGGAIGDRAANMTNNRRADALLRLIAAQRSGWASHEAWTDLIRDHLAARRGLAAQQRKSTDSRTAPSLG